MNRNDALAYLVVLRYCPVLNKLSEDDLQLGRINITGCLLRLYDSSKGYIKTAIKNRERINGLYSSLLQKELEESNAEVSVLLYAYLMDHRTCPICQGTGDEWFSIRCGTCHGEGSVKSNNSIPDDVDDCA